MDIDTFERFTNLGREIGLEGKELQDFLRDQRVSYHEELGIKREEEERKEREREHKEKEHDRERKHELEMAHLKLEESKYLSRRDRFILRPTAMWSKLLSPPLPQGETPEGIPLTNRFRDSPWERWG